MAVLEKEISFAERQPREENFGWKGAMAKWFSGYGTAFFLMTLMALSAAVSLWVLAGQSLRLDEAQSIWQISRTPSQIFYIVAEDVHVPLYHLLLHFWAMTFGESVVAVRLFSLLFYLLSIPAIYMLGNKAYGERVAAYAAILTSFSPFLLWYGNEARMYSLLLFLVILNQYFFLKLWKKEERPSWLAYGLTAILGIFTHYFFALVLMTQAIFYFVRRDLFDKKALTKFVLTAVVLMIAFAPWVFYVYKRGAVSNTQPQLQLPTTVNLFNTFSEFMFGFQVDAINSIILALWPLAVLLAFFSLRRNYRISEETRYFAVSVAIPIATAFVVSYLFRPFYVSRYLVVAIPGLFLMLSWLFSSYRERMSAAIKGSLVVAMMLMFAIQTVSAQTPVKENYGEAVGFLNTNVTARDIVIASAPFTIYPIEYYYRGEANIETLPLWNRYETGPIPAFNEGDLPAEVNTLKDGHQKAYLILSYDQGYEQKIRDYFGSHFQRLESRSFSKDLTVEVYKLR